MADFYKGYVETRNKKCLMKFAGKTSAQLPTLAQIQGAPEYAGVLDDNAVLIDIDDGPESDMLLDIIKAEGVPCRVYATSRGKHFMFYNNGSISQCYTHETLAIGITADIKIGSKNSYQVLKFGGQLRPIIYDTQNYDTVPVWLRPVKGAPVFYSLGDGDGRNQTMYAYILTMQRQGYAKDDIKQTLELVNKRVLKSPLPDSELATIMRDDAFASQPLMFFQADGKGRTKFLFDKFAQHMVKAYHICRLHGQLYVYDVTCGVYRLGGNSIEVTMLQLIPTLTAAQRTEVLKYIELIAPRVTPADNTNYIAFANGVYDLATDAMIHPTPEMYLTNIIPWNYTPGATSQLLDDTLMSLSKDDPEIVSLLQEAVGYCLYRRQELRKSFILTGGKGNGKSTFLEMLTTLLGEDNVSSLDLKDLGYRFSTASLGGMLANIGDDIGDEFVGGEAAAVFKKIVTGNRLRAEKKGQDEFFFSPYCKLFYSANDIPRIKDKTGAVIDRIIIIPFDNRFDKSNPNYDPWLRYKLNKPDVMEALLAQAIEGLKRVLINQGFTQSKRVAAQMQEYEERNQPIIRYLRDHTAADFINQSTAAAYQKYTAYCISNNFQALGAAEFAKRVKKYYGIGTDERRINYDKVRIFVALPGINGVGGEG